MKDIVLYPTDIIKVIKSQQRAIAASFCITFLIVMMTFYILPKVYMAETVVHIPANYFQNPLIGELVSQTQDPNELRAEREFILQSSLNSEFAKKIGEKYKFFKSSPDSAFREIELNSLSKQIEIIPVTSSQFKVSFKCNNPNTAYDVIQDALTAIRQHMMKNRVNILTNVSNILGDEIQKAENAAKTGLPFSSAIAGSKPHISELYNKLNELRKTHAEAHPMITQLKQQIVDAQNANKSGSSLTSGFSRKSFRSSESDSRSREPRDGTQDIRDDLNKQKHLVSMALELEQKNTSTDNYISLIKEPRLPVGPFFPKKSLFLLFAIIAGLMSSMIVAGLREYYQRAFIRTSDLAQHINTHILGTIYVDHDPSTKV